ncbi:metallophosphoesterase [Miniphocaeibacter halophilus]|uniref:Metallophosphoesterase n=1 Tax=Miniphocaeibacter halophilus TaxID=2931922 RepID=A0AC61MX39_9FIRM|nr:metallophosphoesterase [Miniphocaeibacter halophilus]QQK08849.1 metallophosphoesterase [Miniphocaeibacter halophilus]
MPVKYLLLFVLLIFIVFTIYENFSLGITEITYENKKIPKSFNNYRILQISDYHNKKFLQEEYFLNKVKSTKPDIILITGDIINSRNPKYKVVEKTLEEIIKIAPVYYVTGNHESRLEEFPQFIEKMKNIGVEVLEDSSLEVQKENSKINIIGVNDPAYYGKKHLFSKVRDLIKEDDFNILLSHRPEYFKEYVKLGVDLVFSGHAHGGQIKIPFIGAVLAPNQGFFPDYAEGLHRKDNTSLIISRGIGSSLIPIRVFNQGELVVVELRSK